MTKPDAFPSEIPSSPRHEAILALVRAGHRVVPASPEFGGLWHVDKGPPLTDGQLIALAREVVDKPKR